MYDIFALGVSHNRQYCSGLSPYRHRYHSETEALVTATQLYVPLLRHVRVIGSKLCQVVI
jgi:hypothetical protein